MPGALAPRWVSTEHPTRFWTWIYWWYLYNMNPHIQTTSTSKLNTILSDIHTVTPNCLSCHILIEEYNYTYYVPVGFIFIGINPISILWLIERMLLKTIAKQTPSHMQILKYIFFIVYISVNKKKKFHKYIKYSLQFVLNNKFAH